MIFILWHLICLFILSGIRAVVITGRHYVAIGLSIIILLLQTGHSGVVLQLFFVINMSVQQNFLFLYIATPKILLF